MRTDKDVINSLLLAVASMYSSRDALLSDKYLQEILAGNKDERLRKILSNSVKRYQERTNKDYKDLPDNIKAILSIPEQASKL